MHIQKKFNPQIIRNIIFPLFSIAFFLITACSTPRTKLVDNLLDSDRENHGWYGGDGRRNPRGLDGIPAAPWQPEQLAVRSVGCQHKPFRSWEPPRWPTEMNRCPHFEQIDLFLSLSNDQTNQVNRLAQNHPWLRMGMQDRVRVYHPRSIREVQMVAASLLAECKIVRRLFLSTHGTMGELLLGNGLITTSQLFADGLTPCLFSQESRIQLTACLQGCGQVLNSAVRGLTNVFSNPRYLANANAQPFQGMRILMNTDEGIFTSSPRPQWLLNLIDSSVARPTEISRNGVAAELTFSGNHFNSDIEGRQLVPCRGCHGEGGTLSLRDDVRQRLEDPWNDQSYRMRNPQSFLQERRREIAAMSCPSRHGEAQPAVILPGQSTQPSSSNHSPQNAAGAH